MLAFAEYFREELSAPQSGVFPDSRRLRLSILEDKTVNDQRIYKIKKQGRRGFVWLKSYQLPEIVVKLYHLGKEDKRRLTGNQDT